MNSTQDDVASQDIAIGMARQSLYRFTALALLDPAAGRWRQLNELRDGPLLTGAALLLRDEPGCDADTLGPGEQPISALDPNTVFRRLPGCSEALNEEYESTFGLLVSNACPPYETDYINSKFTFQRSNTLGDIAGFYRAFGLAPSTQFPERPDHIVMELEFMAFLIGHQRRAEQEHAPDRIAVCRAAQARFLSEHLAWWTPAFARLLTRENPAGFYEAVGLFLAALVPAERSLLGVTVSAEKPQPSFVERSEECDQCALTQLDG